LLGGAFHVVESGAVLSEKENGSQADLFLVIFDDGMEQGKEVGGFFRIGLADNFLAEFPHQLGIEHNTAIRPERGFE
jgi:hypothetical protein